MSEKNFRTKILKKECQKKYSYAGWIEVRPDLFTPPKFKEKGRSGIFDTATRK